MLTSPARMPLMVIERSGLPDFSWETIVAAMPPADAERVVVTQM